MKTIANYKEFYGNSNNSVSNYVSDVSAKEKPLVIEYLEDKKHCDGVRCSSIYDYVKEFSTGKANYYYTDGEFSWDSEIIYHYVTYNVQLDPDFLKKIQADTNWF